MDKYNICLINDSFPPVIDGVANAVVNYARLISDMGRAEVITPFYPEADDSAFSFPVLRYPSLNVEKLVGYRAGVPFSAELMRRVESESFDLIHSHCPVTSTMLARMIRDRIDKPIVMTYHTKFDIDVANAIRGKLMQQEAIRLMSENISSCDEVWAVSRGAGENLRRLGYEGDYIVMPNGVDLPRGRVDEDLVHSVTQCYDLPEDVPVYLFVGRMKWYKGIRIILDALKTLKEYGRDYRCVLLGGGTDLDEIKAYTETLGLSDRVIFVPPIRDREQIRAWYCRADLFLFPSTFDTNGLVVREAAACALPSVLVAGSCAAEDVDDGVSGFLIEENAQSMAALLLGLSDCPDTVRRVGENAQKLIYMSWEDAVKNAWERYGIVIENYSRGLYSRRECKGDELFRTAARTMGEVNTVRDRAERILGDAQELRRDMLVDFNERQSSFLSLGEQFLSELYERTDALADEIRDARAEIAVDIRDRRREVEDILTELYRSMDRFL